MSATSQLAKILGQQFLCLSWVSANLVSQELGKPRGERAAMHWEEELWCLLLSEPPRQHAQR